jgi:hypothetical protein
MKIENVNFCPNCGSDKIRVNDDADLKSPELLCDNCGEHKVLTPLIIKGYSEPPPTPLATLQRISERCLQNESDIEELSVMGMDPDGEAEVDDLKGDIQNLTFRVQEILDRWESS